MIQNLRRLRFSFLRLLPETATNKEAEYKRLTLRRQDERQLELEKLTAEHKLDCDNEEILRLSTEDLIDKLQNRSLTAAQVLNAFLAKSVEVTRRTNCITQFIPEAKKWARELDCLDKPKGPLHGLPFGVKEDHDIVGMDTTLGFAKFLNKPAQENAAIVDVLMDLGAIPFCKTNVPQSLLSYACDNPIYGETVNSLNPLLGPGGSSGGSACLVAGGGAVFATGSDIGGSLRIPALFHGLCSLRPTIFRLSDKNIKPCNPNLVGLRTVTGVITKDALAQIKIFKALTAGNTQNDEHARALPIPWNESVFQSKRSLRIGYYTGVDFFPALGDTPLTVLRAKEALESVGHTLIPFDLVDTLLLYTVYMDLMNADKGKYMSEIFANEEEGLAAPALKIRSPYVRTILTPAPKNARRFMPSPSRNMKRFIEFFLTGSGASMAQGIQESMQLREDLIEAYLNRMNMDNLDLLLGPGFAFPAINSKACSQLGVATIYTTTWNLLDFPAGVVKFGIESGNNIDSYKDHTDFYLKMAKTAAKDSVQMPIGVQVIGRPFNEELVLRVLGQLEELSRSCGR